ncbi:MAG: hypothetical protein FJ104_15425, partial [Deltaproteobacteria bacterium]|nr:hypothetical protein [Deltaproteobacteria bacterium]
MPDPLPPERDTAAPREADDDVVDDAASLREFPSLPPPPADGEGLDDGTAAELDAGVDVAAPPADAEDEAGTHVEALAWVPLDAPGAPADTADDGDGPLHAEPPLDEPADLSGSGDDAEGFAEEVAVPGGGVLPPLDAEGGDDAVPLELGLPALDGETSRDPFPLDVDRLFVQATPRVLADARWVGSTEGGVLVAGDVLSAIGADGQPVTLARPDALVTSARRTADGREGLVVLAS